LGKLRITFPSTLLHVCPLFAPIDVFPPPEPRKKDLTPTRNEKNEELEEEWGREGGGGKTHLSTCIDARYLLRWGVERRVGGDNDGKNKEEDISDGVVLVEMCSAISSRRVML
jgi:hypothetical protein